MKNIFENKAIKFLSHFTFWSWNSIFVILIISVVIPTLGFGIIEAFISGEIPYDFTIILILAISVPIISIVVAVKKFLDNPKKILYLFYGVEIPLIAVLFLRLTILRELTPGTYHLLILFILGTGIFLYDLINQDKIRNKTTDIIKFIGSTILLLIGIYIAIITLYYVVPPIIELIINILKFNWVSNIGNLLFSFTAFIFILFFLITTSVFLVLPIIMPYVFISNFIKLYKQNIEKYSRNKVIIFASAIIILNIVLFHALNIQPQEQVFAKYKNLKTNELTITQKQEIIKDTKLIKKGLVNAYLAPYRYLSPDKAIGETKFIQYLLKPFLYKSETRYFDDYEAGIFYENIFDIPIQKAEKKAVIHALQARWDRDEVEAGLLNINDKNVHVNIQKINYTEKDGIAEIEIFENYTNETNSMQEIFYYFSLPESAVITGLWLSDDKTHKKYEFVVSPRGAAQQVYKNEVSRRVDPSLLEQTGPGMYRLRAFPIEAKNSFREDSKPPIFKLWLKYICIEKDGVYALPQLTEKRNAYFDKETKFLINEKEVEKDKNWLPKNIIATTKFNIEKANSTKKFPFKITKTNIYENKSKGNIAIIIDPTFSMSHSANDLISAISELNENFIGDIYFSNNTKFEKHNLKDFDIKNYLFFGNMSEYKILKNFKQKNFETNYDVTIFITDAGTYESATNNYTSLSYEKPLYFLHLNNNLPKSYDDAILETIEKSGGNISGNTQNLISQIKFKASSKNKNSIYDADNNLIWDFTNSDSLKTSKSNNNLLKIAAKKEIAILIQNSDSVTVNFLDKIHRIAVNNEIVTQYSSMIVLVNDRQKEALKKAEEDEDRFDREIEDGKEGLTKPNNPFTVTGTPEPEEWILIIISVLAIIVTLFKAKR